MTPVFSLTPLRLVSIDPGTDTLGLSVHEIAEDFLSTRVVDAHTLHASKLAKRKYEFQVETFGGRYARLLAIRDAVFNYLVAWEPVVVVCESPYMHLFPQTFAALTECLSVIQHATRDYDPCCRLQLIEPSRAKVAVGVSGGSNDKDAVKRGILNTPHINMAIDINTLDEHAIDSIAIGYAYLKSSIIESGKL